MSNLFGRDLAVVGVAFFALIGILAAGTLPVQAADVEEKPLPEACGLLDDPDVRPLMDGLLFKLLVACGRTDELGEVHQSPAEDVGRGTDAGPDVAVSDPSGDSGSSTTQSETSMALNEVTGTVCAGYNDSVHYFVSGEGFTGFSRSTDDGATFVDQGALGANSIGDPAIVWRKADGHFYFGALHTNGLGLWKSTDDCQSFQWLGMMHSGSSDDKELLAVDNNPASPHYGNLYMVFTNFSSDSRIWALRSTDAGVTWTNSQAISATSGVQGAWPAVAPNGDVFVGWVKFDGGSVTMEIARSTNGGTSYSMVTSPAANVARPQDPAATGNCGRAALKGNIRYLPSPQVVVGRDGVLHAVYTYSPGGGDASDVFYRRSTDSGATWGPEVRLHDDATTSDQFFPTISVGASNTVSAAWYDRRLDAANLLIDYYHAFSYDGGLTWEPNQRLSDVSTPIYLDPSLATCYHGDYDTQAQTETTALIQWSDDRRVYNSHNDPDVYVDTMPICLLSILAPTASAGVGGPNLIQVGWDDSATSEMTEYRVFRSFLAGGPYELIATVPDSSPGVGGGVGYTYSDYDVSGGTEYFYIVRSSDGGGCISDPSNEVSAVATGDCTLPPLFAGIETVVNPALNECSLELGWSDAVSRCSGDVTYSVYRSTTQGFIPAPHNQIASGMAGIGYADGGPLQSLVRHYYVVRAVDSVNGAEEENIEEGSGVPTGPFSIGTWIDDAGDTGSAMLTPESPWSVAATGGNSGPHVYLTGTYGNNVCSSVTSPSMMVGSGSTLSFWSKYQIENGWDKGVVEISSDGGSNWVTVPVNYPGSSGNTADACGLPTGAYFTGSGTPTWAQYTASLAAWDGLEVMLRWRLSTDGSVTYQGWWVDDISISNVMVPSACDSEPPLYADGFESGDTSAWDSTQP